MANPHKGEVEIVADDRTYTLQYSIDALCSMEAALGKNFTAIAAEMSSPSRISVSMVRQLLYSGLQERHPELTLKEAGELIPAAGGMLKVMTKVTEAISVAFPEAKKDSKPGPQQGPRRAGTGRPS
ncbi:hypothetical protein IVB12_05505 [Bradyrhizobium sp. 179]|uniref:GTA-gp10 family protein n=1 Tax=Bradyrhizobium sp. 179 TaxID=2782648 RepID=UPI001FFA9483|nr:GTA-gp10 family protein [Bradyrhizobium sp. 179]MCK1541448.1 hypothetical protein [Bradyrhizobium sp. 179]